MPVRDTFRYEAPAEVVFDVLTDPTRVGRWLPGRTGRVEVEDDRIRLVDGDQVGEYQISVSRADLRVVWSAVPEPGLAGWAVVEDGPAGGGQVRVRVDLPGGGPGQDRVLAALAEIAQRLGAEVAENFNAG